MWPFHGVSGNFMEEVSKNNTTSFFFWFSLCSQVGVIHRERESVACAVYLSVLCPPRDDECFEENGPKLHKLDCDHKQVGLELM